MGIIMLTFLRNKTIESNTIETFNCLGEWKIVKATMVSFGQEMLLDPEEFEMIEDKPDIGLFFLSDLNYTFNGNQLFHSIGTWEKLQNNTIRLTSNYENYILQISQQQLIYHLIVDQFISYKIYFQKR